MQNFIYVDQTLGYALKKGYPPDTINYARQKIEAMGQFIFDIPLELHNNSQHGERLSGSNVRVVLCPCAEQLKWAHGLDYKNVKLVLGQRGREEILELERSAEWAAAHGIKADVQVAVDGKDFSGVAYLADRLYKGYGINGIVLDDASSRLDPITAFTELSTLAASISCPLEYHGRNGMGLASGNALGAAKSGMERLAVSIGGVGGYPAFEEVVMGLRYLLSLPVLLPPDLALSCKDILECVGEKIPYRKAVIGSNIFAHESGIHVDGIIKKSDLYEPFSPETVGLSRKIVIGKHSGSAAIELKLKELNISVCSLKILSILDKVRVLAIRQKSPVLDDQLQELVSEVVI